ncbi:electron transport complex subunit RsxC [Marispirochaeta aestuarii]|uniref:Ion-translocating oxidoreductase complex subunit C n=1 Tax=Marispirochaeta aestuarii TaxID=1963862 RepID=A0A1Y1RW76_9SPIO|nr:electron transport complex subunit RsxC [Marispirochaeta aestuarii]ORC34430.1 electron transport complex subunit RsxC [Marispirochaeta aestuarii]
MKTINENKTVFTFTRGGIHPPDNKHYSEGIAITDAPVPELFIVPLSQHLGSPAEPVVEAGDTVAYGDLLAKSSGFISANIHSPCAGEVKEFTEIFLPHGGRSKAVVIASDGSAPPDFPETDDWKSMGKEDILKAIADYGIVGMGGATFPAHVKFSLPKGYSAEYLVINGTECEPYLTSDHRLMLEKTEELFKGMRILHSVLEPKEVRIGIEKNKPDAIARMQEFAAKADFPVRVFPLKVKYPQGDEKQLLKAVINREVPSGALPIEVGAVVANIGTVNAVYEAVACKKALYERIVTVSGGGIKKPVNLKARVGTPVSMLIEEAGGTVDETVKLVAGGPMMGFAFFDPETPVTKGTSGILALTEKELRRSRETACISCGRCVAACPMGLNPSRLFKFLDHQEYEEAMAIGLLDCKECGCCGFSCPAHIPLVQGMKGGKYELRRRKARKDAAARA